MRLRRRTRVRACGPYRTSEPPQRAVRRRFELDVAGEALVILGCGSIVLVGGLLCEHAVGSLATLGLVMVGAAVWEFFDRSSMPPS